MKPREVKRSDPVEAGRGRALSPESRSRDVVATLVNDAVEEALGFGENWRSAARNGRTPKRSSSDD
jgi:hypothetical protein